MNECITVWYVKHFPAGETRWTVEWFATETEAQAWHAELVARGYDPNEEDGDAGALLAPDYFTVDLSRDGVVYLLNLVATEI